MRRPALIAAILAAMAASWPAAAAWAGSMTIEPIGVNLIGGARTATVRLRNTEAMPVNLQVRTMDWSLKDGDDAYVSSKTLVASPPAFVLKPGEAQTVRLVIGGQAKPAGEIAYRLIIDQIPTPNAVQGASISVPIRFYVPVFLTPSTSNRPKLQWSAKAVPGGVMLTAANSGDARERVSGLTVASDGKPLGDGLFGYVLASQTRSWTIKGAPAAGALTLSGNGLFGPITGDVAVTP